ncbi:hypothetical protein [Buttiauxella sp. S19-1]|uniref:hypothetical protein n=1 Tax=Buttiauxella sp. S19-1 TaxID=941430 RepID=UPI001EDA8E8F|nr:hypothetical protein [Buttiauxella sp. S19-1]
MQQVNEGWPWGTMWAAISAMATVATFVVAAWAMFRWRKQDELKVKLIFKQAIGDYAFQLVKMPEVLFTKDLKEYESERRNLTILFHNCFHALAMTENLLDENKVVTECWAKFFEAHQSYITGQSKSSDLDEICTLILSEPFVFGK